VKRSHKFVVQCRCGAAFVLVRPRRVLGGFKVPEGHEEAQFGHDGWHLLHYKERLAVLKGDRISKRRS
jgi:hypothetical protein